MPKLPDGIKALLFDVDGVLTDTASVHARAWKETFDEMLERLGEGPPFDARRDYEAYVDGKPRLDGVRGFLEARGIDLPEGSDDDAASELTVQGVGRRKNERLHELIEQDGVKRYEDGFELVHAARAKGLKTAVVSSSANARAALESADLSDCFDTWVDGVRITQDGIPGKPRPDAFLTAARDLGLEAAQAAVLEDAVSGVKAGRAGDFGWVIGVDRTGHAEELRSNGADVVVDDLTTVEL